MKLLLDFFPILAFFLAYRFGGIYIATGIAIVASFLQVGFYWYRYRRVEKMHLVSLGMIVVLGGLTIALHEKSFVMWKPTLINWVFGIALLATQFIGQKPLIRRLLDQQVSLPHRVWVRLNAIWAVFFFLVGAGNIYFVHDYFRAEAQLRSAVPNIQQEQVDNLACSSDFSGLALPLCEATKRKENNWVNFKTYGQIGLIIGLLLISTLYLTPHLKEEQSPEDPHQGKR